MHDTTIKKVEADSSPRGEMGQKYLVAGKRVSMRLWTDEPGGKLKHPTARDYETVGYVISGSAKLNLEGQTLNLKSRRFLVGAGRSHSPIYDPRTLHGCRGDRPTSRSPRSRRGLNISLSEVLQTYAVPGAGALAACKLECK